MKRAKKKGMFGSILRRKCDGRDVQVTKKLRRRKIREAVRSDVIGVVREAKLKFNSSHIMGS